MHLLARANKKKPQEYQDWDDMLRVSTKYHIEYRHVPKGKGVQ